MSLIWKHPKISIQQINCLLELCRQLINLIPYIVPYSHSLRMGKTRWFQTTIETRCWFQKKKIVPRIMWHHPAVTIKIAWHLDAWKHSQCRIQSDHHTAKVSCQHHLSFLIRLWGWMRYGEFVAFMVVDIYPRKGFKSIIACNCKVSWANNQSVLPENYTRTVCKWFYPSKWLVNPMESNKIQIPGWQGYSLFVEDNARKNPNYEPAELICWYVLMPPALISGFKSII